MSKRALMLYHMPDRRADRVSRLLAERGFDLDWCCPAEGHELPRGPNGYDLMVVYGGVQSANDSEARAYIPREIRWIEQWVSEERPYLGLCLGAQLLARALDARVERHPEGLHEVGFVRIEPTVAGQSFLSEPMHVYHWHKEGFDVPVGAELLATGETFPNQAFRYGESAFGLQFHPEVTSQIMHDWIREAGPTSLDEPGAHSRERQVADAARFDEPMGRWLSGFLDAVLLPLVAPRGNSESADSTL